MPFQSHTLNYTPAPSGSASFHCGRQRVHDALPVLRRILLRGKVKRLRKIVRNTLLLRFEDTLYVACTSLLAKLAKKKQHQRTSCYHPSPNTFFMAKRFCIAHSFICSSSSLESSIEPVRNREILHARLFSKRSQVRV